MPSNSPIKCDSPAADRTWRRKATSSSVDSSSFRPDHLPLRHGSNHSGVATPGGGRNGNSGSRKSSACSRSSSSKQRRKSSRLLKLPESLKRKRSSAADAAQSGEKFRSGDADVSMVDVHLLLAVEDGAVEEADAAEKRVNGQVVALRGEGRSASGLFGDDGGGGSRAVADIRPIYDPDRDPEQCR